MNDKNMQHVNLKLMDILLNWDPLGYGKDSYDTEAVDVLQAVHVYENDQRLAKKIQSIYEFSFEELIPLTTCTKMAQTLLKVKNETTCEMKAD